MENIGGRVKALRMAQGWSQTEAATHLSIKQPSLADIESGKTKSLAGLTLATMCRVFHTTAEYLMFGTAPHEDPELPLIEAEMLYMLRGMSPERRSALLESARGMFNAQNKSDKNNPFAHAAPPPQARRHGTQTRKA